MKMSYQKNSGSIYEAMKSHFENHLYDNIILELLELEEIQSTIKKLNNSRGTGSHEIAAKQVILNKP